jgi:hypothetical protein
MVPNRKQNFTHTLCSLLSAIIKIAKPPSRHLQKSHNNNNTQPRLTPRGRLIEYCVDSRHLAAHRATTSSSRAIFKFRLFLSPTTLSYNNSTRSRGTKFLKRRSIFNFIPCYISSHYNNFTFFIPCYTAYFLHFVVLRLYPLL